MPQDTWNPPTPPWLIRLPGRLTPIYRTPPGRESKMPKAEEDEWGFIDPVATQGRYLRTNPDTPVLFDSRNAARDVNKFAADLAYRLSRIPIQQETRARIYRGDADDYLPRHTPEELKERREAEFKELMHLTFSEMTTPTDFSESDEGPVKEWVHARRERVYILEGGPYNKALVPLTERDWYRPERDADHKKIDLDDWPGRPSPSPPKTPCHPPTTVEEAPASEGIQGKKRGRSDSEEVATNGHEEAVADEPVLKKLCLPEKAPISAEETRKSPEPSVKKRRRSEASQQPEDADDCPPVPKKMRLHEHEPSSVDETWNGPESPGKKRRCSVSSHNQEDQENRPPPPRRIRRRSSQAVPPVELDAPRRRTWHDRMRAYVRKMARFPRMNVTL